MARMTEPPAEKLSARVAFARWLKFWKPIIEKAQDYRWEGSDLDQFWPFVRRAVIIRQFEALQATDVLIEAEYGHFGGLLLRPAFEELVWIEYLQHHLEIANQLVLALL